MNFSEDSCGHTIKILWTWNYITPENNRYTTVIVYTLVIMEILIVVWEAMACGMHRAKLCAGH
jgi:hypothetical protein